MQAEVEAAAGWVCAKPNVYTSSVPNRSQGSQHAKFLQLLSVLNLALLVTVGDAPGA
jgi:hypothetical protein